MKLNEKINALRNGVTLAVATAIVASSNPALSAKNLTTNNETQKANVNKKHLTKNISEDDLSWEELVISQEQNDLLQNIINSTDNPIKKEWIEISGKEFLDVWTAVGYREAAETVISNDFYSPKSASRNTFRVIKSNIDKIYSQEEIAEINLEKYKNITKLQQDDYIEIASFNAINDIADKVIQNHANNDRKYVERFPEMMPYLDKINIGEKSIVISMQDRELIGKVIANNLNEISPNFNQQLQMFYNEQENTSTIKKLTSYQLATLSKKNPLNGYILNDNAVDTINASLNTNLNITLTKGSGLNDNFRPRAQESLTEEFEPIARIDKIEKIKQQKARNLMFEAYPKGVVLILEGKNPENLELKPAKMFFDSNELKKMWSDNKFSEKEQKRIKNFANTNFRDNAFIKKIKMHEEKTNYNKRFANNYMLLQQRSS